MRKSLVVDHFSTLAEQGVWASLYEPGAQVNAEKSSFLIRARRVMELLESTGKPPKEFLDLGCGTAPLGPAIVAMGSHYTGIDFSAEMIEAARRLMEDSIVKGAARLTVGDAANLDFPAARFDAIVAMGLLEYFSRNEVERLFAEIARVLVPGGVAIVTIPKRWNWGKVVNLSLTPLRKAIRWRPRAEGLKLSRKEIFERLYLTPAELDAAAQEAAMHRIGHRHYNVQLVCGPLIPLVPRLAYLINRPFERLAQIPGGSFLATGYIGMYTRD
jgi:ubiquinone/menaquinone biosynthesis C-methylase UbiE